MLAAAVPCAAQEFQPTIPKAWDDKAVEGFEVPLAQRDRTPRHLTAEQYYALKVRPIYRSYPAYAKGREPEGYMESLMQKEPEIIFDPSKLHTKEDWINAGRIVFDADILFRPAPKTQPSAGETPWPVGSDGVLAQFVPGFRYYIRKKGVLEAGVNSCANCHTRIMPDGSIFEGGQGIPNSPSPRARIRNLLTPEALRQRAVTAWINYGAPWVMGQEAYQEAITRVPVGAAAAWPSVFARQGTSLTHPVHVPSLVGTGSLGGIPSGQCTVRVSQPLSARAASWHLRHNEKKMLRGIARSLLSLVIVTTFLWGGCVSCEQFLMFPGVRRTRASS